MRSFRALDRRSANQSPRILGVRGGLVLGGEGVHRSGRWCAVRVDQLPVKATVVLVDELEMGIYGPVIAPGQEVSSLPIEGAGFNLRKGSPHQASFGHIP